MVDEDLSHEVIAVNIEDAIRMNASCMAIQTFIGAPGEKDSIDNLCKTIDAGNRYGIPTLGVVSRWQDHGKNTYVLQACNSYACRIRAHIVKTYYCDDFEEITAACPVPIVVAGGKKVEEKEALTMAFRAMDGGARGLTWVETFSR